VGAVQKLATVVIVGLVGLATLLVVYLADEPNRRAAEAQEQQEVAVERAIDTYIQNCLVCHGPAGEGLFAGDGRIGFPLNPAAGPPKAEGDPPDWHDNQTDNPAIWAQREQVLYDAINNGRGAMPAWGTGAEGGALLNQEQIYELVEMIHTVDWNLVYNEVIEANHGAYPPAPTAVPSDDADEGDGEDAGAAAGGGESVATLIAFDIGWELEGARTPGDEIVLTVAPGDTITVRNTGASLHDFAVDELGILVDAPAGETVTVTIPADAAPGEYRFYCSVPGHAQAGMVGTLVVE
jgi:heme/copper-type cytochrome/quinol oxidase subunit 2